MIADDEPKIRAGIKALVEGFDLNMTVCTEARNGIEALQKIEESSPDIVLLDICMPRLNGVQFLKMLREKNQNCMVIIISGFDDFEYAKEAIEYGVGAYLLKPLVEKELYDALNSAEKKLRKREAEEDFLQIMNYEKGGVGEANQGAMVHKARKYMCEHFSKPELDLTHLAKELNSNPAYISRMMKREMGMPFKDFLIKLRIASAVELMKDKRLSIAEIAERVGYGSQHYFSAAFKNIKQVSPSEYRKELLHGEAEES